MLKVYLACPYTHSDVSVREFRATQATLATAHLLNKYLVFSPITHGHPLALTRLVPGDWPFWKAHCASFLTDWADVLFVLPLKGWEQSVGVIAEIKLARSLGMEITLLEDIPPIAASGVAYVTPAICHVCGCTDDNACLGGCWWVEADLCSACAGQNLRQILALADGDVNLDEQNHEENSAD